MLSLQTEIDLNKRPRYAICNETFGDLSLDESLAMAKDAGYLGWEVAPFMLGDDPIAITPAKRTDYRQKVSDAGLTIIGLHWLLAKTDGLHLTTDQRSVREKTAKYLGELAVLCHDLGGQFMVLGSPQQRNFPPQQSRLGAMQNAAEVLRSVAPVLHQTGVKIALEPLGRVEGNFLNTAAQCRELMQMVDDPSIGLHLDVKAMSDEPAEIAEIITDNADALIHFHANDPNLRGPGMGDVDFRPIMKTLDQIQYDGWISVEVFDYSPGVETLVRQSIANLESARD